MGIVYVSYLIKLINMTRHCIEYNIICHIYIKMIDQCNN